MPQVQANGIWIHYETHGTGAPLVLIGGLGADTFLWFRQVPELCKHFQVIVFDNRGSGDSDKPDESYSVQMFAADTAGLLRALGIERAHVLGASLGGMIAQQFAIDYPALLDRLVLASTTFGGPHSVPIPQNTLNAMMNRTGDPETDIRSSFKLFTSTAWQEAHPEVVDEYVMWHVAHPQPPAAYQRQAIAGATFNAEERVNSITAPTLVAHGADDRVVPADNARLLAVRIPHSRLVIFDGGGHAFNIELADEFNQLIIEFLRSNMNEGTGGPDRHDMPWRIRAATVEDSLDLLRMRRAMFVSIGYDDASLLDRMVAACAKYFAQALPAGECRAWVAEAGGQAVGCGVLLVERRPPSPRNLGGREGHILNVYTEPEWRGRGIATAITQIMLEQLRADGITMASLHASPDGRPIYERLGFQSTNEMRLLLPPTDRAPET